MQLCDDDIKYLKIYGPKFNEKLCQWAVSRIKNDKGNKHFSKDEVIAKLDANGVKYDMNRVFDYVFYFNQLFADFYPQAIKDEASLCAAIQSAINDLDGYPSMIFTRFYADQLAKGEPINLSLFI